MDTHFGAGEQPEALMSMFRRDRAMRPNPQRVQQEAMVHTSYPIGRMHGQGYPVSHFGQRNAMPFRPHDRTLPPYDLYHGMGELPSSFQEFQGRHGRVPAFDRRGMETGCLYPQPDGMNQVISPRAYIMPPESRSYGSKGRDGRIKGTPVAPVAPERQFLMPWQYSLTPQNPTMPPYGFGQHRLSSQSPEFPSERPDARMMRMQLNSQTRRPNRFHPVQNWHNQDPSPDVTGIPYDSIYPEGNTMYPSPDLRQRPIYAPVRQTTPEVGQKLPPYGESPHPSRVRPNHSPSEAGRMEFKGGLEKLKRDLHKAYQFCESLYKKKHLQEAYHFCMRIQDLIHQLQQLQNEQQMMSMVPPMAKSVITESRNCINKVSSLQAQLGSSRPMHLPMPMMEERKELNERNMRLRPKPVDALGPYKHDQGMHRSQMQDYQIKGALDATAEKMEGGTAEIETVKSKEASNNGRFNIAPTLFDRHNGTSTMQGRKRKVPPEDSIGVRMQQTHQTMVSMVKEPIVQADLKPPQIHVMKQKETKKEQTTSAVSVPDEVTSPGPKSVEGGVPREGDIDGLVDLLDSLEDIDRPHYKSIVQEEDVYDRKSLEAVALASSSLPRASVPDRTFIHEWTTVESENLAMEVAVTEPELEIYQIVSDELTELWKSLSLRHSYTLTSQGDTLELFVGESDEDHIKLTIGPSYPSDGPIISFTSIGGTVDVVRQLFLTRVSESGMTSISDILSLWFGEICTRYFQVVL